MSALQWVLKNRTMSREDMLSKAPYKRDTLVRAIRKAGITDKKSPAPTPGTIEPNVGIPETEFRKQHDILYKLRVAVKGLRKGVFHKESEFREQVVRIDSAKFRQKADLGEFDIYKGRAGGFTYWGHPESVKSMKAEGVML